MGEEISRSTKVVWGLHHAFGGGQSWGMLLSLAEGGGVHGKRPQMANIEENGLGDGSFESPVHEEGESRSPDVLVCLV